MIALIIGIMDIDYIRTLRRQIIRFPRNNRHIIGVLLSFIMHSAKASVRILVKIGNRYNIRVAVRISVRRFPDTLQGIPHGRLIGQKQHARSDRNIVLYAVFNANQFPPQAFIYLSFIHRLSLPYYLIGLIKQLAVIFQKTHRCKSFSLCGLDHTANLNRAVLALLHQRQRPIGISRLHGFPECAVGLIKQTDNR